MYLDGQRGAAYKMHERILSTLMYGAESYARDGEMTRISESNRPVATGGWWAVAALVVLAYGIALLVLAYGIATPARAESDVEGERADKKNQTASTAERERSDHWTLGAGVAARPEYQGSDDYSADPVPLFDIQYGRFFAKTDEGIGANIVDTPRFTAGAGVNLMDGYDGDDVAQGVDDADIALGARIFASTRLKGVVATLAATQAVTDTDRGLLVDAELAYPITASERFTITPSVGVAWANDKYMDGYFGIDASESAASGLRQYRPTNGFKDVSFRISARYRITDSISGIGAVGVSHLLGEAADSPIVERETQPVAFVGLAYTF